MYLAISLASVLISLVSLVLVVRKYNDSRERELVERDLFRANCLVDLLSEATSGEVLEARDLIGRVRFSGWKERRSVTQSEVISSYYRLAWFLEKCDKVADLISTKHHEELEKFPGYKSHSHKVIVDYLGWNLTAINDDLLAVKEKYSDEIEDSVSSDRLNCVRKRFNHFEKAS